MKVTELIAKLLKGETLSEAERESLTGYDPQKEIDTASAAARRKAETARQEAETKLAAAEETLAELREQIEAKKTGTDSELAKLQKQVAKLTAANEKLEASNRAAARKEAIATLAKANGVIAAEGISSASFERLLDIAVGETDVSDEDAMKAVLETFKADNPAMIAVSVKGGTGVKGTPATRGTSEVKNPWKQDSFNLTEQIKIETSNPTLAATMKTEAGVSA